MTHPIRALALAFAAFAASIVVLPVHPVGAQQQQAVQRIPVSSILGRLDRLESEIAILRQTPSGAGDEASMRLDQLEGELRRLTGIVERLEYDLTRQAEITEKRLLDFETRLQAVESQRPSPFAAQPVLPTEQIGPLATSPTIAQPPAPFALAPQQPGVKLDGGPAVAFGAPRQVDTPPDLGALPFPVQPLPRQPQADTTVAIAGTSVAPAPAMPVQQTTPLQPTGPQARYDDALRLLNLGEFEAAGAALEALVAQYPQDVVTGSAHYWLGDMHLRLGSYNEAAKAFLDSFKGWPDGPKAPDSLLKLGMTLSGLGQREEACLTFTEFPGRYPGASEALLRRAQIEAERAQCGG